VVAERSASTSPQSSSIKFAQAEEAVGTATGAGAETALRREEVVAVPFAESIFCTSALDMERVWLRLRTVFSSAVAVGSFLVRAWVGMMD